MTLVCGLTFTLTGWRGFLRQSGLSAWLNGQLKTPAPQGLSIMNSHLPSACLRNTSEVVPSIRNNSSKALRIAAEKLSRLAEYMDENRSK